MKKFLTVAVALAIFATTPALAQPNRDDHGKDDHGKPAPAMSMKGPAMSMHGPSMSMKGPAMSMHGHPEWKKGGHIGHDDWGRGVHIDYREHHLKKPPRGYEWRQVDGNYILAAAATGLIASMILASH